MSILYLGIYARFLLDKKWKDEIINSENVVATNFKGGEFDTFKKGKGSNKFKIWAPYIKIHWIKISKSIHNEYERRFFIMSRHKVEITGVNTANIKVLTTTETIELFKKMKEGYF